ncbi:MAG: hypothetical protein M1814_005198 [Vezdaea aestivalis]|nr:MAG: hypothetical protein M1814_005198 [Vezdaea aestivalis]
MAPPLPKTPLKILLLHGYTQSGPLYRSKTRALEKALVKALPTYSLQLSYPTAPHLLLPADSPSYFSSSTRPFETSSTDPAEPDPVPAPATENPSEPDSWGWYTRDGEGGYVGLEAGLEVVARAIRQDGPFDGVIGFSQGAAVAVMVAALLEEGRRGGFGKAKGRIEYPGSFSMENGGVVQVPVGFVVSYAGFRAPMEEYEGFYDPRVGTRTLCVRGSLDTVVGEERGEALMRVLRDSEELVHLGGHFVPSGKRELAAVCGFVRDALDRVKRQTRIDGSMGANQTL